MIDHTPGPWRIIDPQEDKLRPYGVQMGKEGGFMVPCYTVEQSKHNARLIAAAPDMFEELQYRYEQNRCGCGHPVCKFCEDDRQTLEVLRKAKGEKE